MFERANPAFLPLFNLPDLPEALAEPVAAVEAAFADQIAGILQTRNPAVVHEEIWLATRTVITVFRGVVGALSSVRDVDNDLAELKTVIYGCLKIKALR